MRGDAKRPKLITFYTKSHEGLFREFLKPSFDRYLADDLELVTITGRQKCASGIYYEQGWFDCVKDKIRAIAEFVENEDSPYFVFADADIVFLDNLAAKLEQELGDCDIAFQMDGIFQRCSGFYVCRINRRTREFFRSLLADYDDSHGDQWNINRMIRRFRIKHKGLSRAFFSIWRLRGRNCWQAGMDVPFPDYGVVMFHANWTYGVDSKRSLLRAFSELHRGMADIVGYRESNPQMQLTAPECISIYSKLCHPGGANLLVFGLGHDSQLWANLNAGRTVFLEDQRKWILDAGKSLEIYPVRYNSMVKHAMRMKHHTEALEMDIPKQVADVNWDVIVVDGPEGHQRNAPGRMQSIYMASKLVKETGFVFVHDCDRRTERVYSNRFLGEDRPCLKMRKGRFADGSPYLWRYGGSVHRPMSESLIAALKRLFTRTPRGDPSRPAGMSLRRQVQARSQSQVPALRARDPEY